jgi:imidazoleglycerol-phosphate dehydratase
MPRNAHIERKTNETDIVLDLDLDGGGYQHKTGVGFLDHMLDHIGKHAQIMSRITATGDTHIDDHHTVEDVGIVLGQALAEALGDKKGIERYGYGVVPMDESLARVAIDLSGRAALVYRVDFQAFGDDPASIGKFDVQLIEEFFNAVAQNARMNLHIEVPWGSNNHHIAEAIFKAFGRALRQAIAITGTEIPSTKGSL